MKIIRHPAGAGVGTAIAIGSFDGVHLGHQAVLAHVVSEARARGLTPAVLTFEPLPREFLSPQNAPARLTSLRERLAAIADKGIEIAFIERFHAGFAAITPAQFAERLHRVYGARWVMVGPDFRFGSRRAGDVPILKVFGGSLGFEVAVLAPVTVGGERVSSTRVRDALARAEFTKARQLLGRPYSITGRVMHGAKRGRWLGFPTANIRLGRRKPALHGIFAVKCYGAATRGLEGVASLGLNPAVRKNGPATLEAFLFDFDGDLYGRRLRIEFLKKLRDEAHFATLDELAERIAIDCDEARAFFRSSDAERHEH